MTYRLNFDGIVQGIGFRPSAQRIARELGLGGYVKNSGGSVEIIAQGDRQALNSFVQRLELLFCIKSYTVEIINHSGALGEFKIIHSSNSGKTPFITPDLAICADCEKELKNKADRRYNHPFISCVNCGPRYTIIRCLPYDRKNTAMGDFEMCAECKEEYTNPPDRRCHAQTIACNSCGPRTNIPVGKAAQILKSGEILAIKDIGGYHLACRADRPEAVEKIRKIKGRDRKPFAVMFRSVDEAEDYCVITKREKEALLSPARPIVLLQKKRDFDRSVCGDSEYIGAFLPCNPLQILILDEASPLVMTSANVSGEPIITSDEEIRKLGVKIISHDREILTPIDDSVVNVCAGKLRFIRRARGYVPLAIDMGIRTESTLFCAGGDLKSAFAFAKGKYVYLSQHFGDLENADAFAAYKSNIARFASLHSFNANKFVCDAHPSYFSSGIYPDSIRIQHHKAHIASVLAEHKINEPALGFAFDGTGYGDDGAIWGGEVILFENGEFTRREHLEYVKMLAGDSVAKNADLALACYLGGDELVKNALKNNINTVLSSSMGRLFDAVCALLDIKHKNTYEGECACALEACAKAAVCAYPLTFTLKPITILNEIKTAYAAGVPREELALGFHMLICDIIVNISQKYKKEKGIKKIALSGGVFNNRLVTETAVKRLKENGFEPYINELVPCGDGGIALGQAYIAALEG